VRTPPSLRLLFMVLGVPALLDGCGGPLMRDLDGRPVPRPVAEAWGDGLWLVVDSTAPRPRVLLEIVRELLPEVDPHGLPIPRLRLGFNYVAPRRTAVEVIGCQPLGQLVRSPRHDADVVTMNAPLRTCLAVVRAEFLLDEAVTDWKEIAVLVGNHISTLRWTHPPGGGAAVVRR